MILSNPRTGETTQVPEKPVPDEYGRIHVFAVNYYSRTDRGARCMPTMHNLRWDDAIKVAQQLLDNDRNYWVSIGIDSF